MTTPEQRLTNLKELVEKEFKIQDISTKSRADLAVVARAVFFQIALRKYHFPPEKIGAVVKRDRTTVLHSKKQFPTYLKYFSQCKTVYDRVLFDSSNFKL